MPDWEYWLPICTVRVFVAVTILERSQRSNAAIRLSSQILVIFIAHSRSSNRRTKWCSFKGIFSKLCILTGVTDAVGFSLDRRAIAFAAKRCIDDNQIQGLRFYPGKNGTQNFILTIDLIRVTGNSFLNEKTGSGAYFPYDLSIKGHGDLALIGVKIHQQRESFTKEETRLKILFIQSILNISAIGNTNWPNVMWFTIDFWRDCKY